MEVNLTAARNFLSRKKTPGRTILCAVTGSHFYGFPAPDSDLDLKGIHLAPINEILGLFPPDPTVNSEEYEDGVLCDYTSNELQQALRLLLKGNGNMLERIFSPIQLFETQELKELREMSQYYLCRRSYFHYKGFFQQVCEQHEKEGKMRIKSLLYAYRTALTGIHLLTTGHLSGNLRELAPLYNFPAALELISIYESSSEKKTLSECENMKHRSFWPALIEKLTSAFENSPLPEEPEKPELISDWLLNKRLSQIQNR
ncbi:MAG: nucleotidyltransferase domain-containing protein [Candidatus Riflebacteria bacterium]|nr:nucleotidyltransferase domain-containing protein [Candidatus Riflebacteria bacterium]